MKRLIIAIEKITMLMRIRHFLFLAPIVVLGGVLVIAVWTGQTAEKAIVATLVDTEGKSYSVTALQAKYTPGGQWIGGRPTTLAASLHLKLYMVEGRVTTTEQQEFPFSSIRRLVFDRPKSGEVVRIELVNGAQIVLTDHAFEKIEVDGRKRTVQVDSWSFNTGDRGIDGFRGRSKTQSGKEGEFWIDYQETRSIEFR